MKKISIITVIFNALSNDNGKEYLEQMFKSVHDQDYENIEHVIIDGCSTDGTLEYLNFLIKNYSKKPVIMTSQKDTGIYNAMNKGIAKSSGDFIAFMNTDDCYLENNAINLLSEAIEFNENISFSCSNAIVISNINEQDVFKADIKSITYRMPFCHQTMLCKKELFETYGLFDESLKIASDFLFIFKIIINGVNGVELNKNLVLSRFIGISFKKKLDSHTEASKIIHEYCSKKNFSRLDCFNIYSHNISPFLLIKIIIFPFLNPKYKIGNLTQLDLKKRIIKNNFKFIYSAKHFFRIRFIIKPIERMLKSYFKKL